MFRLELHPPLTQASILATHMFRIKFQEFSIVKLEEERKLAPLLVRFAKQDQYTRDNERQPIHACVRKIQSALCIFSMLVWSRAILVHCSFLNYQHRSGILVLIFANPLSPALFRGFRVIQQNSSFCEHGDLSRLEWGCVHHTHSQFRIRQLLEYATKWTRKRWYMCFVFRILVCYGLPLLYYMK